MKLYCGIDLHSNNNYVVLLDEQEMIMYQKRLPNKLSLVLEVLSPYREQLEGVVVESTYNWYWLVDGLQEAGYQVYLANTSALQQYSGLKHTDDKTDATWLAQLLRLNILKTGYIYPKHQRGLRELLRRRMVLVKQQTMNILGIQSAITRYENIKLSSDKIKRSTDKEILHYIKDKQVKLAVKSQLFVLRCLVKQISELEKNILGEIRQTHFFNLLKSIPGIGDVLAMTILLETGDIRRFASAGNYSSYCRCVESKRISNAKKKGENNRRNGNHYLGWAFIESANYAIRYSEQVKKYYQRKLAKTSRVVALKTVANKLSKACYFILRDGVQFEISKIFN